MPNLDPIEGKITITSNTAGVSEATSAVNGFASAIEGISGIAAGIGLEQIAEKIVSVGETALSEVAKFQTATTAIGTVLGNVGDASTVASDAMAGGGAKMADIARQQEDLMIAHTEKVKKLQDEIADAMKGDNVIDAQNNMYQQLDDLAENHAQKILSLEDNIKQAQEDEANREADRAQKMQDSLADMDANHKNQMADKEEKYEQEIGDAKNQIAKDQITKKYDEEKTLAEDSYQRQLATKTAQEQRNNDESNANDRSALQKKLEGYQDEITKENDAYQKAYAKDKATDEQRIDDLKAQNAKKLTEYKQELDDEDRLYQEHLDKLRESAASGGGASGSFTKGLDKDDPFKAQKTSLQSFMQYVNDFSGKSPFNLADITQSGRMVESMQFNFEKLAPIISNIAAGTGQSFGTTTQALMDAVNGRLQMTQMTLGISKERLEQYGAEFDKQGHLINQSSLFKAFDRIANTDFKGATENQLHTFAGALSNVQDNALKAAASLLGFDATTGKLKDGPLKALTDLMIGFGDWLRGNMPYIQEVFTNYWKILEKLGDYAKEILTPAIERLEDVYMKHKKTIDELATMLRYSLVVALVGLFEIVALVIDIFATLVDEWTNKYGPAIDAVYQAIVSLGTNWSKIVKQMKIDFIEFVNNVIELINHLIDAINHIPGVKIGHIATTYDPATDMVQYSTPTGGTGNKSGGGGSTVNSSSASMVQITNYNNVSSKVDVNQMAKALAFQVSGNR